MINHHRNKFVLPKVLTSTVIRTAKPGEFHGHIYFVDLQTEKFEEVFSWANQNINWKGKAVFLKIIFTGNNREEKR